MRQANGPVPAAESRAFIVETSSALSRFRKKEISSPQLKAIVGPFKSVGKLARGETLSVDETNILINRIESGDKHTVATLIMRAQEIAKQQECTPGEIVKSFAIVLNTVGGITP